MICVPKSARPMEERKGALRDFPVLRRSLESYPPNLDQLSNRHMYFTVLPGTLGPGASESMLIGR